MNRIAPRNIRFASRNVLDGFPPASQAPAFQRHAELQRRLHGIDLSGWTSFEQIYGHLEQEVQEFGAAVRNRESPLRQLDELGDILYVSAWAGAQQNLNPEQALHHATDKFVSRYNTVHQLAAERGITTPVPQLPLAQRQQLWRDAKVRLAAQTSKQPHP